MLTVPIRNISNSSVLTALSVLVLAGLLGAGCGSSGAPAPQATGGPVTVKVGYFPNVTHAAALVGVQNGIFARDLVPDRLDASQTFNAGPAETQALLSQAIDVAFIGPSPSITAFTQSHGAVTIISGAASGGAALVTRAALGSPLPPPVLSASWSNLTFTTDPVASSLTKEATDAVAAGLLSAPKLGGIFDLRLLNQVLTSKGLPQVAGQ